MNEDRETPRRSNTLQQWLSKCGPWKSSIRIIWECIEMQILRPCLRPTKWGLSPALCAFTNPSDDFDMLKFKNHTLILNSFFALGKETQTRMPPEIMEVA